MPDEAQAGLEAFLLQHGIVGAKADDDGLRLRSLKTGAAWLIFATMDWDDCWLEVEEENRDDPAGGEKAPVVLGQGTGPGDNEAGRAPASGELDVGSPVG